MKILFLLTQDLDSPSGVGRYFPMARGLVRSGLQVSIVALHANFTNLAEKRFTRQGVDVEYVGQMHVLKQGNTKSYFPAHQLLKVSAQATTALWRAARDSEADIIHIGKPHPMNSVAGLLSKIRQQRCVFLDCDDYEATSNRYSASWQRLLVTVFEDFTPRFVDHLTTHNTFLQNRLLGLGIPAHKITYLPNGVDFDRFIPPTSERVQDLRNQLGLHEEKVIAYIGSLSTKSHPLPLLFEAFARVQQNILDCKLLVVGGGDDYDYLVAEVQAMGLNQQVLFCGRVPADEIPIYYRLADVLVDPVYDDPTARGRTPLKLFESWISETPFVTGDAGDRRLLLGSPPAGLIVPPGDSVALSQAIQSILENPSLTKELRQRGLLRAEHFNWDHLVKDMINAYQASIRKRS